MPEHVQVASERPFITCTVERSSQPDGRRADKSLAPNVDVSSADGHHVEISKPVQGLAEKQQPN